MTNRTISVVAFAALALSLIVGLAVVPILTGGGTLGVTNFDSLTLSDDLIVGDDATIGGDTTHTGQLSIADDLKVGDGTPSVTLNGEDAYIEGTLEVDGAARFDGALTATSTGSFTGRVTANGGLTVDGGTAILASTSITPTNGGAFALTRPWVVLTPAGAVTPTITIPAAGVTACIHNSTSNAVVIADTGNQVLAGSFTLGQYDVLCVRSDGTRVIEFSRSNN